MPGQGGAGGAGPLLHQGNVVEDQSYGQPTSAPPPLGALLARAVVWVRTVVVVQPYDV